MVREGRWTLHCINCDITTGCTRRSTCRITFQTARTLVLSGHKKGRWWCRTLVTVGQTRAMKFGWGRGSGVIHKLRPPKRTCYQKFAKKSWELYELRSFVAHPAPKGGIVDQPQELQEPSFFFQFCSNLDLFEGGRRYFIGRYALRMVELQFMSSRNRESCYPSRVLRPDFIFYLKIANPFFLSGHRIPDPHLHGACRWTAQLCWISLSRLTCRSDLMINRL